MSFDSGSVGFLDRELGHGGGPSLQAGDRFGAYHIQRFLAAGGMGEVYVAVRDDDPSRQPLALKVLSAESAADRELIKRLRYEAEFCRSVRSKHAIKIHEFNIEPTRRLPYMAMEFLDGEELFERMERHRIFSLTELADMAIDILRGLHDIHQAGIIHRDIKPENIFLTRDDEGLDLVKILDFGIARRVGEPDPFADVVGQIFGTPEYLAPEQASTPEVDHRADIYSFGVVMYQCAAGNLPYDEGTAYATVIAHKANPIPPLPSTVDPEFCEIIFRAMAKRPEDRFQTAGQMAFALRNWLDTNGAEEDFFGGSLLGGASFDARGLGLDSDVMPTQAASGPAYNSGRPRTAEMQVPSSLRTPHKSQSFVAPPPDVLRAGKAALGGGQSIQEVRAKMEQDQFQSLLEPTNTQSIPVPAALKQARERQRLSSADSGELELDLSVTQKPRQPRPRPDSSQLVRKPPPAKRGGGGNRTLLALILLLLAIGVGLVVTGKIAIPGVTASKPAPKGKVQKVAPKTSVVGP